MVYILWGEDEFSLNEALDKVKKNLGDRSMRDINTTLFEGQELTVEQLRSVCDSVPFMAEKRLVIVNGLLTRFNPKERGQSKKNNVPLDDQFQRFADFISRIPESTILVLVDTVKLKATNPLLKLVSSKAVVQSYPVKYGFGLQTWIKERVAAEGGRISPEATKLMAELVGGNLRSMTSEIKKLVLFTSGRMISENDIKQVVSEAREHDVFAMVDAIFDGKAGVGEQILQQLLDRGVPATNLLTMIARQVRIIVVAKELKALKKSETEIREKLGINLEFIWRKVVPQIDRYSLERLKLIHRKLLETDLAIKTGKYNDELALNMLVAELSQR